MDLSRLNRLDSDEQLITSTHAFFYGSWLSNFYKSHFMWKEFGEEHEFFCTEQAFMWAKSMTFKDFETAKAILSEDSDPMTVKHLGRMVQNYDDSVWDKVRFEFMYQVNLAKYRQNSTLNSKILDDKFEGKTFVEASPSDGIWGIKRPIGDPKIDDEKYWRGHNLLGKVLTKVRDTLKSERSS